MIPVVSDWVLWWSASSTRVVLVQYAMSVWQEISLYQSQIYIMRNCSWRSIPGFFDGDGSSIYRVSAHTNVSATTIEVLRRYRLHIKFGVVAGNLERVFVNIVFGAIGYSRSGGKMSE